MEDSNDTRRESTDGRRSPFFKMSKDFPLDDYGGRRVLDEFGLAGIAVWVGMWAAAKRADVEGQLTFASDTEFWALLRIPLDTPDLPDLDALLKLLGRLHQTRTRRRNGLTTVVLTKYDELQTRRPRRKHDATTTRNDEITSDKHPGQTVEMSRTETETTNRDGNGDRNGPGQSVEHISPDEWRDLQALALASVPSSDSNGKPITHRQRYAQKKLANPGWVGDRLQEMRAGQARSRSNGDLEEMGDLIDYDHHEEAS